MGYCVCVRHSLKGVLVGQEQQLSRALPLAVNVPLTVRRGKIHPCKFRPYFLNIPMRITVLSSRNVNQKVECLKICHYFQSMFLFTAV